MLPLLLPFASIHHITCVCVANSYGVFPTFHASYCGLHRLGQTRQFQNDVTLCEFVVYLAKNLALGSRHKSAIVDAIRCYLSNIAVALSRLAHVSRGHRVWNEESLANVGALVGPKGKCRRISSGVMKEVVELTSDLEGRGVTKPGQLLLGIAVAKEGGARKRDRGLDGFCPVATEPGFEPKGGGAEEECEGFEPPTKHARKVLGGSIPARHGTRCEAHYVYNYFLSCRPFGYVFRAYLQI